MENENAGLYAKCFENVVIMAQTQYFLFVKETIPAVNVRTECIRNMFDCDSSNKFFKQKIFTLLLFLY